MKRIMVALGTRPEAIKLCPVITELKKRRDMEVIVASSGQHRAMLDDALADFGIQPDVDLNVMRAGQGTSSLYARILGGYERILRQKKPDVLLVQGDTATACAAAQAAFYERILIGHVEAGLRTYHIHSPFPEEMHRRTIALMSDLHFAPTVGASKNLLREGVDEKRIFITGNTVVDALRYTLSAERSDLELLSSLPGNARLLVFTAHRREHLGPALEGMLRALRRIVDAFPDVVAVCPVHQNPSVKQTVEGILAGHERIVCIDPPSVISFHRLLSKSALILTDSGGVQEEATALGIPTVVMRYSTERTEGIFAGNLRLAGSGEEGIFDTARLLLRPDSELYESMKKPSRVFGDGNASAKIADVLEKRTFAEGLHRGA